MPAADAASLGGALRNSGGLGTAAPSVFSVFIHAAVLHACCVAGMVGRACPPATHVDGWGVSSGLRTLRGSFPPLGLRLGMHVLPGLDRPVPALFLGNAAECSAVVGLLCQG